MPKLGPSGQHVAVLMGLYNGGPWVEAQLASIVGQDHCNWSLLIGDDGSTDDGPARIAAFAAGHGDHDITLVPGPRQGFARNFLSLIAQTAATPAALVALSDQDDVWLPQRLSRGVGVLSDHGDRPALYCGRTLVCDDNLRVLRTSPLWPRPFSFRNALVQNVAAGNTIMLNPAMADIARKAAPMAIRAGVVAHDWWLYQLATGCAAHVFQDDQPVLRYRQHAANTMGRNDTTRAQWTRGSQLFDGTFARWIDANCQALQGGDIPLKASARALLGRIDDLRAHRMQNRLSALRDMNLHRQTRLGDTALGLATALGRL